MNNYTEEVKQILKRSELIGIKENNEYVTTKHIVLAIKEMKTSIDNILNKYIQKNETNEENYKIERNSYILYSKEMLKTIEEIIYQTNELSNIISLPILLNTLLTNKDTEAYKYLKKTKVDINSLKKEVETIGLIKENILLNSIGTNLNEISSSLDPVIGRDKEILEIIEILKRKNKNNPLLIGEAGVGKTAVVEELARRIKNKQVPTFLENKTIYSINLGTLIAGTKYRGEFEEKLNTLINEIEASEEIILFIDEIHGIVGAGGAEGAIDASNILKPALARGKLKLIGSTTTLEYKTSIEKDKALDRRFQKILINEPTYEETKTILTKLKPHYEKYHNVEIPNKILDLTITLTNKYIKNRKNPDKSIDILDEICAKTSLIKKETKIDKINKKIEKLTNKKNNLILQNNFKEACILKEEINNLISTLKIINNKKQKKIVTRDILKSVLENKTNSVIYELSNNSYIQDLNKYLKDNIINEDKNIDIITNKTKKFLLNNNNLPTEINIKGPTGTGKTLTIKKLSKYLNLNLITLNMKEYSSSISINKILGSPKGYVGYEEKNTIFEPLKLTSLSIILLENYNYANTNIKNLFNEIIKTGELKLNNNEIINLNNTLIIKEETLASTSSIGFINKELTDNKNNIIYNSLTKEDIIKIIKKKKPNINEKELNNLLNNSNYLKDNAKNIDKQLNETYVLINE